MFDNIRALREVTEIILDIKRRDWDELQTDSLELLNFLGFKEYSQNLSKFLDRWDDKEYRLAFAALTKEFNELIDYFAQSKLKQGPRRRRLQEELEIAELDPKAWFRENKQAYLDGVNRPLIRFIRNRHPELDEEVFKAFCDGTLVQDTLSGKLDKHKVIAFIDKILPVLAVICGIFPYAIPVYIVLKIISLIYHHNNDPKLIGLSLEDLL